MTPGPSVLLVDDDAVFRQTLARQLGKQLPAVEEAESSEGALARVAAREPDVALVDLNLGGEDGLDLLARLKERHPSVEVVVVTGFGTVDAAVEAMRRGAFDFVMKPLRLEELVQTIRRAAERRTLRCENEGLRRMLGRRGEGAILGASRAIAEVRAFIARAASSDAPVLIRGPSGTGKELVARAIHAAGPRAAREMVTVNSAALQEGLLESELFGHERGAFTGAVAQRRGLFEAAHGSTLFLDEIGELPPALQAKLLRVLQFGEVRRVGGTAALSVDVRTLAATHRDLEAAVRGGAFREDLYYRLNVLSIRIPPLRERPEDIEPIVRHLARGIGLGYEFGPEELAVLRSYPWPGNVREIENLLERLKIHEADGPPGAAALQTLLNASAAAASGAAGAPRGIRPLAELEREAIEEALRAFGGNRREAARALGISVRTLYYRISGGRGEEFPA